MTNPALKIFLSLTMIFMVAALNAQVNICSLRLVEAKEQFNAGQIEEVPDLLKDCLRSGFTREDKIEAYKLMISAYIFDDNPDQAEIYMLEFLNEFPGYEVSQDDLFEFVNLYEQFDNSPRYSIGIQGGTNLSMVRIAEPFGVYDLSDYQGDYKSAPGFQFGGSFNFFLNHKLELSIDPMFIYRRFKYELIPFPFTQLDYKEMQGKLDIPFSAIYSLTNDQISPYLRGGFQTSFLFSAKAESIRSYGNTGGIEFEDIISEQMNISDRRIPFNFGAFLGGGVRYKLPKAYFFADLRYNIGLTRQVNSTSRRNANDDQVWMFYHIQDDFFMHDFSFTIGYAKNFFKPRRKF